LPRRGNLSEVFAATGENLDPQLIFKHTHLLTDAGLRGIKTFCSGRDVKVVVDHLYDIAKLL